MIRYCDYGDIKLLNSLGNRVWFSFDLNKEFSEAYLNFKAGSILCLHIRLDEEKVNLCINSFKDHWLEEKNAPVSFYFDKKNIIRIEQSKGHISVSVNENEPLHIPAIVDLQSVDFLENRLGFGHVVSDGASLSLAWRQCRSSSGVVATSPIEEAYPRKLKPGLAAIIRAKNEESTISDCISGIADLVDQVVAVDNGSTDQTYLNMLDCRSKYFNVELYRYNAKVPRVGNEHEHALSRDDANTLGRYYNFCLTHCKTTNFMKWDADFIPISENLEEMISNFHLRTRSDNFSLWFSGVSVWTDGARYWIDEEARYNEFRAHSLMHGARWVDLPPWEEMDQSYLFSAQLCRFEKPVFIEIFEIDVNEFDERGINENDARDIRRFKALEHYKVNGKMPKGFTEIDNLRSDQISCRKMSVIDVDNSRYMRTKYNSVPSLYVPGTDEQILAMETTMQHTMGVFCISHKGNEQRQQTIRETYKHDFDQLGIPFYFVVGSPGSKEAIVGDVIHIDCPDSYEYLGSKLGGLCNFFHKNIELDYLAKIDDDSCINAMAFSQLPFYQYHYFGGGIAGGRDTRFDWHKGKCSNKQLDEELLIPRSGHPWYGGGYGYFLSSDAVASIANNRQTMRQSLYEDVAVGQVLQDSGLISTDLPEPFLSTTFDGARENNSKLTDHYLIADIPCCETLRSVYKAMKNVSFSHPATEAVIVDTDWYVGLPVEIHELTDNREISLSDRGITESGV